LIIYYLLLIAVLSIINNSSMKILIAADSFKDALPALEVCQAIGRGIERADPGIKTQRFPLADGGEGTAGILTYHNGGKTIRLEVRDPLYQPVEASYGLSADGQTAFIEMAEASGLPLLKEKERNPLLTTTYGTGELLVDAVRRGARRIILGIGGSATNDCGAGMAAAIGYRFLDGDGRELKPTGKHLIDIRRIEEGDLAFSPGDIQVEVICDVDNPLYGPEGAAYTYAPQKGAGEEMVTMLDEGLRRFSEVLKSHFGRDFASEPGAGAAGGLGAGAMVFLGAKLRPGIETVMEYTHFDEALEGVDLLLTGEGKIDAQTARGKLIHGICRRASRAGVPVIALCGTLDASPADLEKIGLQAAFSIINKPLALEEALKNTADLLEKTAFSVAKSLQLAWHTGRE
jgi:glycerate kinase